jgi:hypothetical protein
MISARLKREKGNITLYVGFRLCRGNLYFRGLSAAMLTGTNRLPTSASYPALPRCYVVKVHCADLLSAVVRSVCFFLFLIV